MADSDVSNPQIGKFRIEAEIGHGSTGVVYRAYDPVAGRVVALKVLAQHIDLDPRARARFQRAAAAVARLSHPHIAQVYEFGEQGHQLYLAAQWVDGRSLETALKTDGPWPLARALRLFDQLAGALDYAHQNGVIHYDLKPANIIVGADDQAVIVDFELAWLSDAPASTNAGMLFGTPRYMAPEQIRGEAIDARADLYSLAAVLYEVLSGQPPFAGDSTPALLYHHLYTPPPPITELLPTLPIAIETALLRALAKRPSARFHTAAELGAALRARSPRLLPRRALAALWWSAASGLILLILLGIGVYVAFGRLRQPLAAAAISPTVAVTVRVGATRSPAMSATVFAGEQMPLTAVASVQSRLATPVASPSHSTPPPTQTLVSYPIPVIPSASLTPTPGQTQAASATPTSTPTATQLPSLTPVPSATAMPPTLTLYPPTVTPSLTSTPTPVPAPQANGQWPGAASRSGFVAEGLPALNPLPHWQVAAPPGQVLSLVAGSGLVIVSSTGHVIRALDWATGATVWNITLESDLTGELTLTGDPAVILVTAKAGLFALDLQSGSTVWKKSAAELHGDFPANLTLGADGVAYVLTEDGWLHAIDPKQGQLNWSLQLKDWEAASVPPALAGSTLLLAGHEKNVRALDLKTSVTLWKKEPPSQLTTPPCVALSLGLVFVGTESGAVQAFQLGDGALVWTAHASRQIVGLATDDYRLYATATDGAVYAWDSRTGSVLWTVNAGSALRAAPLTDGRYVLVATRAGELRYFDVADGREAIGRRVSLNDPISLMAAPAGQWLFVPGTTTIYGVSP